MTQPVAIFVPTGVFSLTLTGPNNDDPATRDLDISHTITLNGAGAGRTIIEWALTVTPTLRDRLFDLLAGDVSICGVTLQNAGFSGSNSGDGGAIRVHAGASLTLMNSVIADTSATVDGCAIMNEGTLTVVNSTLTGGRAVNGGAIQSDGPLTLNGVTLSDNRATSGGGVWALAASVLSSTFQSNSVSATVGLGGGLLLSNSLSLDASTFLSNSAWLGGGAYVTGTLNVSNTQFVGNLAFHDGGGAAAPSLNVCNTQFSYNMAGLDGGGADVGILNAVNTHFIGNTAGAGSGGGLILLIGSNAASRIVNSLFVFNRAHDGADELELKNPGLTQILHTTIADPAFNPNAAIVSLAGTLDITDSTIVSHSGGIIVLGGSAFEDYNLLFGNTNNTFGAVTGGGHDVFANPQFVNPAADDYHLSFASPAIDAGTGVGVWFDIDGDPRPIGAGFDIGYDEFNPPFKMFLPLIER